MFLLGSCVFWGIVVCLVESSLISPAEWWVYQHDWKILERAVEVSGHIKRTRRFPIAVCRGYVLRNNSWNSQHSFSGCVFQKSCFEPLLWGICGRNYEQFLNKSCQKKTRVSNHPLARWTVKRGKFCLLSPLLGHLGIFLRVSFDNRPKHGCKVHIICHIA